MAARLTCTSGRLALGRAAPPCVAAVPVAAKAAAAVAIPAKIAAAIAVLKAAAAAGWHEFVAPARLCVCAGWATCIAGNGRESHGDSTQKETCPSTAPCLHRTGCRHRGTQSHVFNTAMPHSREVRKRAAACRRDRYSCAEHEQVVPFLQVSTLMNMPPWRPHSRRRVWRT